MNPLLEPKPGRVDPVEGPRWMHIHNRFISETKEREPDVIILGDALACQVEQRSVWREVFAPMHALNFSAIGDLIPQILWRVQNGELDNIKPKVVVLYVGQINLLDHTPDQVVEGTLKIFEAIREKQPDAYILVQELLPRGMNPNPLRDTVEQFNSLLRNALLDNPQCKVVPVGDGLIKADGTISHLDLFDWYYPTNDGVLKAFGPLIRELQSLLQDSNVQDSKTDARQLPTS